MHFLLATCNVCPLVIPEIFTQTEGLESYSIVQLRMAAKVFCAYQGTTR